MKKESYEKLEGNTKNLIDQANKLFRNDNQKSIKTRYRYLAAEERFCKWLSKNTGLKKIKNVKSKHFISYAKHLQENRLSPKMIKSELSGIRHFHALTDSKEILPGNKRLELEKTLTNGGVNRSWTNKEVKDGIKLAMKMGRIDVAMAIKISYVFGTRIEETVTLTNKQIIKAIKNKNLDLINTKGNRPRGVGINMESKYHDLQLRALQYANENSLSNSKIFIKQGEPTHKAIKQIQNWVYNNRNSFQHSERINRSEAREKAVISRDNRETIERPKAEITFHGLRHSYAENLYKEILEEKQQEYAIQNKTEEKEIDNQISREIEREARQEVSKLLGHGRDQITKVYIGD